MGFEPTHIIVHHSLTKDSGTVSWSAIRNYHMTEMVPKMHDIGYHAGIELAGAEYEALIGRAWDETGAHCKERGMNHVALGVCLVGNFDVTPPPDAQLEVARDRILLPWMRYYNIDAGSVHPHRLYAPKTCPGTAFTGELMARFLPGIDQRYWR